MEELLAGDSEVLVQRAQLRGHAPFPTWNGTIAAAGASGGRCSVLCESGDVLVLQARFGDAVGEEAASFSPVGSLQVERILRSPTTRVASFCQCWSADGSVFATAHDRRVTFYNATEGFRVQLSIQLRFSVTTMDIAQLSRGECGGEKIAYLLAVGTAFGAYLYTVQLSSQTSNQQDDNDTNNTTETVPSLASAYIETPICFVQFAHDGLAIALGSVDGRLYVRSLRLSDDHSLSAFGSQVLAKVLAAPRVTSISFSACGQWLAAATRKGNVYVFARVSESSWQLHQPCKALSDSPKPVASSGGVAPAMQTFVSWWGSAERSPPVLVVASRSANYRLELIDARSGALVHTLQLDDARVAAGGDAPLSAPMSDSQRLLMGVCRLEIASGRGAKLVCHDTDANVALLTWAPLEVGSG